MMMFSRLRAEAGRENFSMPSLVRIIVLGEEKARSEFFVVSGRPHRCRNGRATDTNLERLFNGEIVALIFQRAVLLSPDDLAGSGPSSFIDSMPMISLGAMEICHLYISSGTD